MPSKKISFLKLIGLLQIIFSLFFSPNTNAQGNNYPNQAVHLISPFPPGGAADIVVRIVSQKLTENLKSSFIVDNKPGAGGAIGAQFVQLAQPDGYTLLLTSSSTMSINPHLQSKISYNPFKNFTPIALIGYSPNVLVIGPNQPFNKLTDFIQAIKKNPGKYSFASNGTGTLSHLTGELFKQTIAVDLLHVPYKGAAPAVVDVASGQVTALFAAYASVGSMVKSGKLKPLGVTSLTRIDVAKNVPTLNEMGIDQFEAIQWWGLFGPANLPPQIVKKMNFEINKVLNSADIKQRLSEESVIPIVGSPEDLTRYMRKDYEKWGKLISTVNLSIQ